jgi:histidinol-phosphate aminotransferase
VLNPRKTAHAVPAYHPPLAGRVGLRLDFNENTDGCSPRVLDRLRRISAEDLAKYPEREHVETTIAEFLGVASNEVLLTNGVDEVIHLLCQTYIEPGDEALIVVPTYSMYRIYAAAAGAEIICIPTDEDFRFPTREVLTRITQRTRLIAIANPNNPTGAVVAPEDLRQIVRAASDAAVLIDEAYFEFYGQTMLNSRQELQNVFVARTFSKAYGLAGLRAGILVGDSEQMNTVRRITSPYNVNAIALACLPEAIADASFVRAYVADVLQGRCSLEHFLAQNGIPFWPSQANFVLMRVGPTGTQAAQFVDAMRRQGSLVRDRSLDPGCEGCVRITVGPKHHLDRLPNALQSAFEEIEGPARISR